MGEESGGLRLLNADRRLEHMVPQLRPGLLAAAEMAVMEMVRFDTGHAELKNLLILAEAAASCSLDGFSATAQRILIATLATSPSAAGTVIACALAVSRAGRGKIMLSPDGLAGLNRTILSGGATVVPPTLQELAAFTARVDIPAMAHAALAHAWLAVTGPFESANGRTARAMDTAMFRAAGVTANIPFPISAGLAGNPRGYRTALGSFRDGQPAPFVELLTEAAFIALDNAEVLAADVARAGLELTGLLGGTKSPAAVQLTANLIAVPALTAAVAARMTGASESAAYRALDQLTDSGILVPAGKANGVLAWTAPRIANALQGFLDRSQAK